jgi:hypothetical protein
MWLGRGDFEPGEWRDALAQAREIHNEPETEYLIGTPLLADYLEEAHNAFGYSHEAYRTGRLWRVGYADVVHAHGQDVFGRPIAKASSAGKVVVFVSAISGEDQ